MKFIHLSTLPAILMFGYSSYESTPTILSLINFGIAFMIQLIVDDLIITIDMNVVQYFISIPYLLVFFLIQSTLFYIIHRILHTSFLYKWVHYVHHEYITTGWWTAFHFHPLELMLVLATFHIPKTLCFILPIPIDLLIIWNMISSIYFLYTHGKNEILPIPLRDHWIHHVYYKYNYSSEWIDILFNTRYKQENDKA